MTLKTVSLWISLIAGLFFSVAGYQITNGLENNSIRLEQSRTNTLLADKLTLELQSNIDILNAIRGLYMASEIVNRNEFKVFTKNYLSSHPSVQALEWIPRVIESERAQFQQQAIADGLINYKTKILINGETEPLRELKQTYFPVYYVEPLEGNRKALGFDLSSNPTRHAMLIKAIETGLPQATANIKLVQETGIQNGVLLVVPIFHGSSDTALTRQANLAGFALGVFRIGDLFASAKKGLAHELEGLHFALTDISDAAKIDTLYSDMRSQSNNEHWSLSNQLDIAGRIWQLTSFATDSYVAKRHSLLPVTILGSGLVLTLLLVIYLRGLINREYDIRHQVNLRTQQLEASEERNKLIVENAANAVISIADDFTVASVNPAARQIFGYNQDQFIGLQAQYILPELEQHNIPLQSNANITQTGIRKDGTEFPLSMSLATSRVDNENTLVAILYDDTKRMTAEQQLIRAKEAAEEANQQKSVFLNMMSHELRTPLTVILGYIPILQNPGSLPTQDVVKQIADDISVSGNHLMSLIDDLLDISKIEAGQMTLRLSRCNVQQIIQETLDHFAHQAQQKQLKLINNVPQIELDIDPKRFRQILFNLVGNALKFTHQGEIELSAEIHNPHVTFSIRDTGIGIPQNELKSVFEAFKQVDNSSTRKVCGSGLGLAITKRLAELHGGNIKVISTEGQGTEFKVNLPGIRE